MSQSTSETVETETEIPKERYISPEEKQQIIYEVRYNNIILGKVNLLDNTPNEPFKFRTKNWVKTNDDSWATCNTNSQIKFKTSMLKSSLCDYSYAYILAKGTITAPNMAAADAAANNANKRVVCKT